MPYPPFNFIVDHLRACGAGFEGMLDLLQPHTSQPPVLKEKADAAVAELLKSLPKAEQRAMPKRERATVAAIYSRRKVDLKSKPGVV